MGTPEPDIYLVGTSIGGLPTCTFPPKTYARRIKTIVVGNSVASSVAVYRGQLGSTPVAQNPIGANNTIQGDILIPAGQIFFVQWSLLGALARDAFARVTSVRDDNPLEDVASQEWSVNAVTSLTIPSTAGPTDDRIVISGASELPSELVTFYTGAHGMTVPIGGIVMYSNGGADYVYIVWGRSGTIPILAVGGRTSSGIKEIFNYHKTTAGPFNALTFPDGADLVIDGESALGASGNHLTVQGGARTSWTGSSTDLNIENGAGFLVDGGSHFRVVATDAQIDALEHEENFQGTASTTASTSYANLTNIAGTSFVAPTTGKVTIFYTARLANDTAGDGAAVTPWVGTGSTVGSGTEFLAASDARCLLYHQVVAANKDLRMGGQFTVTGLTPGTTYNVSIRARAVTGGTATIDDIATTVVPSP